MKTYDSNLLAELAKEEACIVLLIDIDLPGTTKRYNDSDIVLYHNGEKYIPHPIDIETPMISIDLSSDTASLRIADVDKSLLYEFQTSDASRSPITISFGAIGPDFQFIGVDVLAAGYLDSWERSNGTVHITMCNIFRSWYKKTLRKTRSACQWYWKSQECGYSGGSGTPCNQTKAQCKAYGNNENYGGFRYVDLLEDVVIYWGRNPS